MSEETTAQMEDRAHPEYTAGWRGKLLHTVATRIEEAVIKGEDVTLNLTEATEVLMHLRYHHYTANDMGMLRALLRGSRAVNTILEERLAKYE
jgi:hypothetical protein